MRSVMSHSFANVPQADIPRSSFDRTHGYKTTFNSGYLIPFFVDEALPGDTFNLHLTAFARMATLIYPIMDNMFLDTFFFFIPNRLIWNNWVKMNGEQDNPGDSTDYLVPKITSPVGGYGEMSIFDYMGLPTKVAGFDHSALPLRAYNLVYNEWFRDENLISSLTENKGDGPDLHSDYTLKRRGKRHDYFTSCLPWPQKGTAVSLPLGTSAPVKGIGKGTNVFTSGNVAVYESGQTSTVNYVNSQILGSTADQGFRIAQKGSTGFPDIYADLTSATAATINQLRQAFQVQRLYERDARGGSRYTEIIRSHFGVVSPDARLQRPEYLGGGSVPVNVNPVAQTSSAASQPSPQANLAAYATVASSQNGFVKAFTEHGIILGLMSIRADLTYQQGLNRMWSRRTRFDHYWPALSHLGEQSVLNKEIYCKGDANDSLVFGYQEAWAEYRYKPSLITGQFRSNAATPLHAWHLAQNFTALPVLNGSFIEENPPVSRVVATPTYPEFLFDSYIQLKCSRPMPVYSVPGMIDHF